MRTSVLIVASVGRRPRLESVGGLAARLTGPHRVHLIGTAQTPLGGDWIDVRVVVEAGATLAVHSVAATVVLPSARTNVSHSRWTYEVGEHATLVVDPQPMIVAATAFHTSTTRVEASAVATVRLRERVQIGRSHERDGSWVGALHMDVDSRPRLRHRLHLGRGPGSDVLARPGCLISELEMDPVGLDSSTPPHMRGRVEGTEFAGATTVLPMAGGGVLRTTLADRL